MPRRHAARPRLTPLEDRTTPATFTVDTLSDVTAADGRTTLREAVALANATPGADVIAFAPALAGGTIALGGPSGTGTGLSVSDAVTIVGFPDNPVTVAGEFAAAAAPTDALIVQAGATAGVSGLRISNATPGGHGIVNAGTLALDRATITGVTGGSGLLNVGTATVTNCVIAGNKTAVQFEGGGVTNAAGGTLTVRDTQIVNNQSTEPGLGSGGGLASLGGRTELANVLLAGNAAAVGGGGVFVSGGVFVAGGGTRIAGNSAALGGGLAAVGLPPAQGTVRIPNVTLTGVVVDGNTARTGGGVAVAAFNGTVFPTVALTDTAVTNNKADADSTATIEIGFTVAVPGGVGGGLAVAGGAVTVTGGSFAGNSATAGGGVGVFLGTLTATGTAVTANAAVSGAGAIALESSAGPTAATFSGVAFTDNAAAQNATGNLVYALPGATTPAVPRGAGGGLYATATVTVTGGSFTGNRATDGGAAAAGGGTLDLIRVTATGNAASARGGGVAVRGGATSVTASTADGNAAGTVGGGFAVTTGALALTNATVAGNRAAVGGGLATEGGTTTLFNSTVAGNTATVSGGGVSAAGGALSVRSSVLAGNAAPASPDAAGVLVSAGGNVVGVADAASAFGVADRVGTAAVPLDPRLGALAFNGGPTRTRLPAAVSAALDHGSATAAPTTDQRGRPRVSGAGIDAGAVERQADDPSSGPRSALPQSFAAGSDVGQPAAARLFNSDGTEALSFAPFAGSTGGVRVATTDLTGDGVDDLIVGTGPGVLNRVQVIDGRTKAVLFDLSPFEATFTGGVFVAVGDLGGDGTPDLIVTPDEGGGPVVVAYDGTRLAGGATAQTLRFLGIEDPGFRGGARAAVADVTGDGRGDLVVAAGFGGGPRVSVWDGASRGDGGLARHPFGDFFVFEPTLRNGVYVAAGDLNGDGYAEVIAGGGPGGGPRVFALSGKDLTLSRGATQTVLANFFAGDPSGRDGVRLTAKDLDGDARADLVTGSGGGSRVTRYLGGQLLPEARPPEAGGADAFAGFTGGVFVG